MGGERGKGEDRKGSEGKEWTTWADQLVWGEIDDRGMCRQLTAVMPAFIYCIVLRHDVETDIGRDTDS